MQLNQDNYQKIKSAFESREEIEFEVPREATAFSESSVPTEWAAYPPLSIPEEEYVRLLAYAGPDARGALNRFEILAHLNGGRILYKAFDSDFVSIRITWPLTSNA